jgi:hypothetical protein
VTLFFRAAQWYIPTFLKKRELMKLFNITSEAFGCTAPSISDLSFADSLVQYAQFTRMLAEQAHRESHHLKYIQDQLYRRSYELGNSYRKIFHISTLTEAMDACRILYRILGIDFRSSGDGTIKILSCYFSPYYSASTCRILSFLDAGLMAGISGGARLIFSQRITEGFHCCNAEIIMEEKKT